MSGFSNRMFGRFIPGVRVLCVSVVCCLASLRRMLLCMHHSLLVLLPNEHLNCFHFGAILNEATLDILVQVFL